MNTFSRLERCLFPAPETVRWNGGNLIMAECSTTQKVIYYAKNFFAFSCFVSIAPFTLIYDWFGQRQVAVGSRRESLAIAPVWPPEQRGFATSLFQTSGLGTRWSAPQDLRGRCDWDEWMEDSSRVLHRDGFEYADFFVDVLSNPTTYIEMLVNQNVTAHRFSLEWAVIEPRRGEIDENAVALYRNFIEELLNVGITPSVTLSHFTVPKWFYDLGEFQELDNVNCYVNFALHAMKLFPEVKDWWSFNELGIKAFQQMRGVYPSASLKGNWLFQRVHLAGIAIRNMLIAHCRLHRQVSRLYPDKKLGVTHQWLKMDMASGNFMERLIRYFFEKAGFESVYGFFKEGRYVFAFPFVANICFEIEKEEFDWNGGFLMRLGMQMYPKPMIKMGLSLGERVPCIPGSFQNWMFIFGACCEREGRLMRLGPRCSAESVDEFLDEAFALTDEVFVTEYGADAIVCRWGREGFELDDVHQADYLKELTRRLKEYSARTGREIKGIFCWSDLRRQLEWENGLECQLGVMDPIVNENRELVYARATLASRFLAEAYTKEHLQLNIA